MNQSKTNVISIAVDTEIKAEIENIWARNTSKDKSELLSDIFINGLSTYKNTMYPQNSKGLDGKLNESTLQYLRKRNPR